MSWYVGSEFLSMGFVPNRETRVMRVPVVLLHAADVCQFSSIEIFVMNRPLIFTLHRILLRYQIEEVRFSGASHSTIW
jgi:hypothetical protein